MKKKKKELTPLDHLRKLRKPGEGKQTSNHQSVLEHEKSIADDVDGRRHSGSGSSMYLKSDASSDRYQIEAKQTEKKSISLKVDWLTKISKEALSRRRIPLLSIRFLNIFGEFCERDWIMIPRSEFKELYRLAKGKSDVLGRYQ